MKISNDHLGSACSLIDTADLAHVQGGANTFPPGDGSPHPRPMQPPVTPPARVITPNFHCSPGMSPNYMRAKTLGSEYERFKCEPVYR